MFTVKKILEQAPSHTTFEKKNTHKKHFNSLCLIEFNELLGSFSLFFFFLEYVKGFYFNNWWTIECKELCKWNVKIGETVDSF